MVNTIMEVYLGILTGPDLWRALLLQVVWVLVLVGLCQIVLRIGVRKLVLQGG